MSVSPLPFVSPRRRQLPRSGFLYLWFTLVFRPSSGFYFSLPPPVVLTFLCSLVLMTSEQEAAGPPASANATPQNWSFIDKSDVAASPRTTTKPLYIQCFLCSQAVQSPFKSFLFNLIVQAFFIFISSCSLGWTLARCGNRHFQMSFRWHFQVWASRLNLGKCSVENWKLFFFFFQCCFFFFLWTKMLKHLFPCQSQQQYCSNGATWMHTWHNTLMAESDTQKLCVKHPLDEMYFVFLDLFTSL